jgi:peptide-methionine (S)-S-oxide reductase
MIRKHTFFHSRWRPGTGVRIGTIVLSISIAAAAVFGGGKPENTAPEMGGDQAAAAPAAAEMDGTKTAVFAGGCFWGVEAVFERLDGVLEVVSGYSGGDEDTAHYTLVGTGTTGHAESVRIVYDPQRVSFAVLLEVFFNVAHDPTQLNYQGPDRGPQYRSAVFYTDEEQKHITDGYIEQLDAEGTFAKPIVTQVVPLEAFYPAEEYHQDFMRRNPRHPYIVYWDLPKIRHLEEEYPELLAE